MVFILSLGIWKLFKEEQKTKTRKMKALLPAAKNIFYFFILMTNSLFYFFFSKLTIHEKLCLEKKLYTYQKQKKKNLKL